MAVSAERLNECLRADSYQDMTDEEIEAVMKFKSEQAAKEKELEMQLDATKQAMNSIQEYYTSKAATEQEKLAQLLNESPTLITEVDNA